MKTVYVLVDDLNCSVSSKGLWKVFSTIEEANDFCKGFPEEELSGTTILEIELGLKGSATEVYHYN